MPEVTSPEQVTAERKVFVEPTDGYELLPGFVPQESLGQLEAEADELERRVDSVNPMTAAWWAPKEAPANKDMKPQYHRTVAVEQLDDPEFATKFPVIASIIEGLKVRSGLDTVDTVNVNRYRPHTQIPGHNDPNEDSEHRIYSVEVTATGVFRIWPDTTTIGSTPGEIESTTEIPVAPGDVVELSSILKEHVDGGFPVRFSVDGHSPSGRYEYVTRFHSAENPTEEQRTILLIGLR